ncbi:MAG TPA: T9SS type A sorting domain-containing protein [Ignavibacteria bacterium]|nr:T9SS type A sorting domain-containing protein [Ignavibacteria bacterium]
MKNFLFILICLFIFSRISEAQTITAPSECEAEMEAPFYIKVKWNDNSGNEDGFYIERATSLSPSNWETIGSAGQNSRFFNDYWLTINTKYYYRVYAFNSTAVSDYSNVDSIIATGDTTSIPARPTDLAVTNVTTTTITINWSDNSNNELGFIIARRKPGDIAFEYIDTVQTDVLTYQEVGLNPDNVYLYKVCSYNLVGVSDFSNTVAGTTKASTGVTNQTGSAADGFFLSNNYPNPFNPSTTIKFGIPVAAYVSLKIYNSKGAEIETLNNSRLSAGTFSVKWNGSGQTSGVYFYKLLVSGSNLSEDYNFTDVKKMILIK